MSFDLQAYLTIRRTEIESALSAYIGDPEKGESRLVAAMRYSLMAGGKRLRPILCLAGCDAAGSERNAALPAACAIEMIHTYSLIHDDLPAMDDDALRRGRPTCHVAFDEATAILAGDALLTLAFDILSDPPSEAAGLNSLWLRALHGIARAAGHRGMIEGQMQDIRSEGSRIELDVLKELHERKTGALIRASICAGAILGGGSAEQIERLDCFGTCIGLAFQVVDDILNVEGNQDLMGKATGTDQARGKTTYPSLMGLDASRSLARNLIDEALAAIDGLDNGTEPLRALARYVVERQR